MQSGICKYDFQPLQLFFVLTLVADCPHELVTELFFENDEELQLFMELAERDDMVEVVRNDESNFLDSNKTIMYRVE